MTRMLVVALIALGAACGEEGDPDAAAIPCRNACQSDGVTCENACGGEGTCKTACENNELTCLKVCEAQHPTDGPLRCNGDCDRFGAACSNNCTDQSCRDACTNSVSTCKQQCTAQYP